MGKIYEQKINTFNGGMADDKRSADFSKFSVSKHFDVFSNPHRLIPHTKITKSYGENKTYEIKKFLYAPYNTSATAPTAFMLYGLGVDPGTTKTQLYVLDMATLSDTFSGATNGKLTSYANRSTNVLFYYRGGVFTVHGSPMQYIARYDMNALSMNQTYQNLDCTNNLGVQPVHHPADDCAYFFGDTTIDRLNNATYTSGALTGLPSNMYTVAGCAYGNYLAIACVTIGNYTQRSTVFLWDRDSSITTLSERIDFGEGKIAHLAVLGGRLTAVMSQGITLGHDTGGQAGKILVKQYNGYAAVTTKEITLDTNVPELERTNYLENDKIYFPAKATLNGDDRLGIWVVDSNGNMTIEAILDETFTSIEGIYRASNIWWVAHSADGSVNHSGRADNNNNYQPDYSTTTPAIYESLILNGGDSSKKKKLIRITETNEYLGSGGSVTIKYRKDGGTSWTTIFTNSTTGSLSHSAVNIESTGATLPEYKELEIRVESLGGAVITGIKVEYEEIDSEI